jgi:hypothetical protein
MAIITTTQPDELEPAPVGTVVCSRTPTLEEIAAAPRYTPAQLDELSRELKAAFDEVAATFTQPGLDRERLDRAFDRIGHQGSPVFRARVADAYDGTSAPLSSCSLADAVDRANIAVGEIALALDRDDLRRSPLLFIQDGFDMLYAAVVDDQVTR